MPGFTARLDALVKEMDTDKERCDGLKDNAAYLKNQASRDQRCVDMKNRYKRQALATAFKSYGPKLSTTLGNLIFDEIASPVPDYVAGGGDFDHSSIMVFHGSDGDKGSAIWNCIEQYRNASATKVTSKFKMLNDFLSRNKEKTACMSPVKPLASGASATNASDLPDLAGVTVMQLVDMLAYEDQPGSSPWLVVFCAVAMPSSLTVVFPLPGVAFLVQFSDESKCGVSIMLTPVQALLQAGLTILDDFGRFSNTDSGNEVVVRSSIIVTLHDAEKVLFIPMGFLPTVVGRSNEDKEKFEVATFWCKSLLCKHLALAIPHPVWVAIHLLNVPYLQNLQGTKMFKERLTTFEHLCTDVAATKLGFDEAPTLCCDGAETQAMVEAEEAANTAKELEKPEKPVSVRAAAKSASVPKAKATTTAAKSGAARDKFGKSPKAKAK